MRKLAYLVVEYEKACLFSGRIVRIKQYFTLYILLDSVLGQKNDKKCSRFGVISSSSSQQIIYQYFIKQIYLVLSVTYEPNKSTGVL